MEHNLDDSLSDEPEVSPQPSNYCLIQPTPFSPKPIHSSKPHTNFSRSSNRPNASRTKSAVNATLVSSKPRHRSQIGVVAIRHKGR